MKIDHSKFVHDFILKYRCNPTSLTADILRSPCCGETDHTIALTLASTPEGRLFLIDFYKQYPRHFLQVFQSIDLNAGPKNPQDNYFGLTIAYFLLCMEPQGWLPFTKRYSEEFFKVFQNIDLSARPKNPQHPHYDTTIAYNLAQWQSVFFLDKFFSRQDPSFIQLMLMSGPKHPNHIHYGATTGFCLAASNEGRKILLELAKKNPAIFNECILASGSKDPNHINYGMTTGFGLAGSDEGRQTLLELAKKNPLIFSGRILASGPKDPNHINYGMTTGFFLAGSDEGRQILLELAKKNPAIFNECILASGPKDPNHMNYGMTTAYCLAGSGGGRQILLELAKKNASIFSKRVLGLLAKQLNCLPEDVCNVLLNKNSPEQTRNNDSNTGLKVIQKKQKREDTFSRKQWFYDEIRLTNINTEGGKNNCYACACEFDRRVNTQERLENSRSVSKEGGEIRTTVSYYEEGKPSIRCTSDDVPPDQYLMPEHSKAPLEDLTSGANILDLTVTISEKQKLTCKLTRIDTLNDNLFERLQLLSRRKKDGTCNGFLYLSHKGCTSKNFPKNTPHAHVVNFFVDSAENGNQVYFIDAQNNTISDKIDGFSEKYDPGVYFVQAKPPEGLLLKNEKNPENPIKCEINDSWGDNAFTVFKPSSSEKNLAIGPEIEKERVDIFESTSGCQN